MQSQKNIGEAGVILRLDSGAGLLAGLLVLVLHRWLAGLYGLLPALLVFMGIVNLAYGSYSGWLARRWRRGQTLSPALIGLLVAGNAAWAAVCLTLVALEGASLTMFGRAHLIGEAVFVGALAFVEWRRVLPAVVARQQ
ncbi:MAG TPA: hypothetical protein VMF13_20710 [Luteitalea sp.]|nr:hypothetical protein [Luteitalea sp.]